MFPQLFPRGKRVGTHRQDRERVQKTPPGTRPSGSWFAEKLCTEETARSVVCRRLWSSSWSASSSAWAAAPPWAWGLDKKATSSLCAARPCRLVQAEVVRDEVEEKLLLHAERVTSLETDELMAHYRRLVELKDPDAAGIRTFPAEAMGRLTREGPGRRRGQEKQDAGLRLPAQL